MDVARLKKDVQAGVVTAEALLEIVIEQRQTIRRLERHIERLEARLARYETPPRQDDCNSGTRSSDDYGLDREQRRRRRAKPRASTGRRPHDEKLPETTRHEDVLPDGATLDQCVLARTRVAWRIEHGVAVRIAYRVYKRKFGNDAPPVAGVLPHGEHGVEIIVLVAFLVYIVRVSLDQACLLLRFFCRLPLRKSQANALLDQLGRHWQGDFDALCQLMAHAAVLYLDETGWKISDEGCSLWAFQSSLHTVLKFGCRKDAKTLDEMLPRQVFCGTAVSDDATVYQRRFAKAQKCWAHLLRKAIRLALEYPEKRGYQQLLDELLALYREAKRAASDGRLSAARRACRVEQLHGRVWDVCAPHRRIWESPRSPDAQDFSNLVYELFRLVEADELFTFVRDPAVQPTNNVSERLLRGPALDRKTGRASKTAAGAHRRSVIMSVLESLRKNLSSFTLESVVQEVVGWTQRGVSLFGEQLKELRLRLAAVDSS